jgi:hypothetical protein
MRVTLRHTSPSVTRTMTRFAPERELMSASEMAKLMPLAMLVSKRSAEYGLNHHTRENSDKSSANIQQNKSPTDFFLNSLSTVVEYFCEKYQV